MTLKRRKLAPTLVLNIHSYRYPTPETSLLVDIQYSKIAKLRVVEQFATLLLDELVCV